MPHSGTNIGTSYCCDGCTNNDTLTYDLGWSRMRHRLVLFPPLGSCRRVQRWIMKPKRPIRSLFLFLMATAAAIVSPSPSTVQRSRRIAHPEFDEGNSTSTIGRGEYRLRHKHRLARELRPMPIMIRLRMNWMVWMRICLVLFPPLGSCKHAPPWIMKTSVPTQSLILVS